MAKQIRIISFLQRRIWCSSLNSYLDYREICVLVLILGNSLGPLQILTFKLTPWDWNNYQFLVFFLKRTDRKTMGGGWWVVTRQPIFPIWHFWLTFFPWANMGFVSQKSQFFLSCILPFHAYRFDSLKEIGLKRE